jgi:hypothetical protein
MDNEFRARIDAIGDDLSSSATAILMRALELLQAPTSCSTFPTR